MVPEKHMRSPPDPQEVTCPQPRPRPGNPCYSSPTPDMWPSGHVTSHYHRKRLCERNGRNLWVCFKFSFWVTNSFINYIILVFVVEVAFCSYLPYYLLFHTIGYKYVTMLSNYRHQTWVIMPGRRPEVRSDVLVTWSSGVWYHWGDREPDDSPQLYM